MEPERFDPAQGLGGRNDRDVFIVMPYGEHIAMVVFVRIVGFAIFVLRNWFGASNLLELRFFAVFVLCVSRVNEVPVLADRVLDEQHVREAGAESEENADDDEEASETYTNAA